MCCVEGCMKESTHESTALKRDIPLKPNTSNKQPRTFGLCLDHFLSESRDPTLPSSSGESGRMGLRGSHAPVDDGGMDDGPNADDYTMAGGWDDPNAKVGHHCVVF